MSDQPVCQAGACLREQSDWDNCLRKSLDCPNHSGSLVSQARVRPSTRIITVNNPGYDVVLFVRDDGSAQAIISGGDKPVTTVYIAAPEKGRRIVIERKGSRLDVLYRDDLT